MNTVFKSKIFKVFEQCEAHNPLAVVYALSVQSFKHYNRLQRRSCVVGVLGNGIMSRAHCRMTTVSPSWTARARWWSRLDRLARIPSETKWRYLCPSILTLMSLTSICTLGSPARSTACTSTSALSSCESEGRRRIRFFQNISLVRRSKFTLLKIIIMTNRHWHHKSQISVHLGWEE